MKSNSKLGILGIFAHLAAESDVFVRVIFVPFLNADFNADMEQVRHVGASMSHGRLNTRKETCHPVGFEESPKIGWLRRFNVSIKEYG